MCNEFDLFYSDIRVWKMLPKCLGNTFFQRKKYPVPLKIHDKDGLKPDLDEIINSTITQNTVFYMGNGPNYAVRIGTYNQSAKQIQENVMKAIP